MKKEQSHINKFFAFKYKKGFSLVELLVSISIFLIFVIAINDVVGNVSIQTRNSANRERASVLAEEALEAARNIRDADFANLVDGNYGLSSSSGQWNFSPSSDVTDIFTRILNISTVSPEQKRVEVTILWADQNSTSNSLSLSTYFTKWKEVLNLGVGLTVNKNVINHGGSKVASDFAPYNVTNTTGDIVSTAVDLGVANLFPDDTYIVSENTDSNYTQTFSGDCLSDGSIVMTANTTKSCIITNEEKPSYLTVNKNVINHGGSKVASDFTLLVDSNPVSSGVTNIFNSGVHTVSEIPDSSYSSTIGGDCDSGGLVTLSPTITKICTITNEEILSVPVVESPTVTGITANSAVLGANVTLLGVPSSITERGTCFGTTPAPTTNCVAEGGTSAGIFSHTRTGLVAGTTYYYRGYAINSTGTGYSVDGTFTTIAACSSASVLVGTPTVYDSAGSVSGVVSKPVGVTDGDIMFAHIMHFNGTDRLATIPSGWISVGRHKNGNYNQALYYKVAGASEGANYTFGLSSSSKLAITISAYRNCFNTSNPINTFSNVEYIINNTTYRAASVNISSPNSTVLMFPSTYRTSVSVFANPLTQGGGWNEDYDHGATTSDFSRAGYSKFISSAGATGVIDSIGFSGTTFKHAFAVVLRPL